MNRWWHRAVAAFVPVFAVWMTACGSSSNSPSEGGTETADDASMDRVEQQADANPSGSDAESDGPQTTQTSDRAAPEMPDATVPETGADSEAPPTTDASPGEGGLDSGATGFDSGADASSATPAFQQGASATSIHASALSVSATYASPQGQGDLNVVAIGWYAATGSVGTVTDTAGNSYQLAVGPTAYSSGMGLTQAIYYAPNIHAAAAGNVVTVTLSGTSVDAGVADPDLRIAEYSGLSTSSPVDTTKVCSGEDPTSNSCSITAHYGPSMMVIGAMTDCGFADSNTGYTTRVTSAFHDLIEDFRTLTPYSFTPAAAPYQGPNCASGNNSHNDFIMQVVVFH